MDISLVRFASTDLVQLRKEGDQYFKH